MMRLFLLLLILPVYADGETSDSCKLVALQCEYLTNPIGIDVSHPRLSWKMEDSRTGARQTWYKIDVGTDSAQVAAGKGYQWQSGRVNKALRLVVYAGAPLRPFTKYFWKLAAGDKNGKATPASAIASFETGMMKMASWQGAWISDSRDISTKPAAWFRTIVRTGNKKIRSARAYIVAAGLYELYINGLRTGDHRLDPMFTRFDRRNLYITYDITAQLQQGDNAIGVLLGNGWYNLQSTAVWYFDKAPWRGRPSFCMDIRISYTDGTTETIGSGKTWKTALSPIIFNSIYTGEHKDARLEQVGWNTASFADSAWKEVIYRSAPSTNIVAQAMPPIRNVDSIPVRSCRIFNDTDYVFDLGRNISGVSEIRIKGEPGTTLHLKHSERLDSSGHADQSNINVFCRPMDNTDPFQTDVYILAGNGEEVFMPSFNYKGFQYVEVTSDRPVHLSKENLTGWFMHSDVTPIGSIHSSNPTIDKIWQAANNSYLSNLFGYPTDCPQREKNGWTGDAAIAIETGLYNFDGITLYEKWMADHRDEQQSDGVLPAIIPTSGWGYEWANGPDWTSTIAIIPWTLYQFYGDTMALALCYENIKRYVDHIGTISTGDFSSWGLGDWVPVKTTSSVELTSSVYYFTDASILSKAAGQLGRRDDQVRYAALAERIRTAINTKYLNRETGSYASGSQTELSVPLYWGVVPEEMKQTVAANLARRVGADNNHIDVGLLGTKTILSALSDNGYADLAYQVAAQETFPSWGWWIVNGATTLYENWPIGAARDISLNHIMFGEIDAWFYKALAGIRPDPREPGFRNILLQPHFVAGLDHFEATYNSPYGLIVSSWKREKGRIVYLVTIPPNSTAMVSLDVPAGQRVYINGKLANRPVMNKPLSVAAGTYRFEIK